jgi:Leucine-rich repeat (LRR) protein
MRFMLKVPFLILISAAIAFGQTAKDPSAEARRSENGIASEHAASILEKLGIPLERDPRGQIRWIRASQGELTDVAMRYLPDLAMLEWLEIGSGTVTSAGLARLESCVSLRRLFIHDISLRDDDMAFLSQLSRLEALSLQRTGVTGKTLQYLRAGNSLVILNLSGDSITDRDLDAISKFSRLEVLAIQDTQVTGSGLAKLSGMPRLNVLNLSNCKINDGDAGIFSTLSNLRIVHAAGCNLSNDKIMGLKINLPMLAIFQ